MRKFLEKAGLDYKSPHKFRHGFIRFLRDKATSAGDLEAISHNTMQTIPTMLGYGKIRAEDSFARIDRMLNYNTQPTPNISTVENLGDVSLEHVDNKIRRTKISLDFIRGYIAALDDEQRTALIQSIVQDDIFIPHEWTQKHSV